MYIVGSNVNFGCWDPNKSEIALKWSNGNIWTLTKDMKALPKCSEFKFILKGVNGEVEWEERVNRTFDVNIMKYILKTSKNFETEGYAMIDQRTTKLEFYPSKENVTLTYKWGM
uniref:CBM20 domain-containing protein n=1 Tax=Euplotes harpa TaxID=151035 RepID=A0A7S3JAC3_9SPIT|mmetsp:Transcript_25522/g.29332  ORF Transcript_25522/g.29332 Transcript_25522/m.29332 type:complete len:114 (+) Transcript_25522:281-622(+)